MDNIRVIVETIGSHSMKALEIMQNEVWAGRLGEVYNHLNEIDSLSTDLEMQLGYIDMEDNNG